MSAPEIGFTITAGRLAFVVSLIAVMTFGGKVVSYAMGRDYQITDNTKTIGEMQETDKEILKRLDTLNGLVGELVGLAKAKQ